MVLALELTVKRGTRWVADCSPNEGFAWETHQLKPTSLRLGLARCHDTEDTNRDAGDTRTIRWSVIIALSETFQMSLIGRQKDARYRNGRHETVQPSVANENYGNCISLGDGSRAPGGDAATVVHPANLPHPSSLLLPPVVGRN